MDKIGKNLEEEAVWQNPQVAKKPVAEEQMAEKPVGEKQIIEELAQIRMATQPQTSPPTPPTEEERKAKVEPEEERKPSNLGKFIRWFGNFLILVSILGLFFTFWPIVTAEVSYRIEKFKGIRFIVDKTQSDQITGDKVTFGDLLGKGSPKVLIPKSTDFGVIVEKIGANSPVIANVDAANQKEYNQKLQKGVAHAKGSVFPGQKGLSYLFAHSTLNPWDVPRYNAVFYLLREMETGDRIILFYKNVRYDYFVTEKKIVAPNDVSVLRENFQEPVLVLQTCDPPGTTWRRLLVIAKMKTD
jgi:sortase A